MTKKKYFFVRFDDICPTMDCTQFKKAKELVDRYNIKPLLGVIPNNLDPNQIIDKEDLDFWNLMRELQDCGWLLAMHGYMHMYNQERPKTMVCGRKHSEFAGNSYEKQFNMIKSGKECLAKHGIYTDIFFAPGHTYDKNTLKALAANGFKYNIDGFSRKPYKQFGIINIPCRSFGVPRKCNNFINISINHPSEWSRKDKAWCYGELVSFCDNNKDNISDFSEIRKIQTGNYIVQKADEKVFLWVTMLINMLKKAFRIIKPRR